MHEIVTKALQLHHKTEQDEKVRSGALKAQAENIAYQNRKHNLGVFMTRYGFAEPERDEVELDNGYTLTGNVCEILAEESPRCLLIRKCSACGFEESRWIETIQELGYEMEHWQASIFHKEGRCKQEKQSRSLPDQPPTEGLPDVSKAEALVKLLTEIIIEQTEIYVCR